MTGKVLVVVGLFHIGEGDKDKDIIKESSKV